MINSGTADTTIYYTTDGAGPKISGTRTAYTVLIPVTGDGTSKTIRVYAEKAGMLDSAAYTIEYFWSFIFGKFVDSSSGEYDIDWWIKKLDQDGVETTVGWDKIFDGGFFAEDYALAVGIDSSDNVYVADAMSDGVLGKGEETDITCSADVDGNLGSLYFTIYSIDEGLEDGFYVWYNVAASVDPDVFEKFGIEVEIIAGDTSSVVSAATAEAIATMGSFEDAFATGPVVTVMNSETGDVTNAGPGTTRFGISNITNGTPNPNQDCVIKKFSCSGTEAWSKMILSTGYSLPWALAVDSSNDIYIVGWHVIDEYESASNWIIKKLNDDDGTMIIFKRFFS